MNDIELIDEIVRRADEHQKQKEKEFAIAELEDLKSELIKFRCVSTNSQIIVRINNHISELKGENK